MGSRAMWVGNLRESSSLADDLADVFSAHGRVVDVFVRPAPDGTDCWGVVTFDSPSTAAAALYALGGRHEPRLTDSALKMREWQEEPGSWRARGGGGAAASGSSRWADAEDSEGAWSPHAGQAQQRWGDAAAAEEEEGGYDEGYSDYEDDEDDPLVELWVGNLCGEASRATVRRAFECFGEVASVALYRAPRSPHLLKEDAELQYGFVHLPASAAETALEELNGLTVYELSGKGMALSVKQSKRSLKPLLSAQALQRKQHKQQQRAAAGGGGGGGVAPVPTEQTPYEVVLEDGRVVPLVGPIRHVRSLKNHVVCEGPPFNTLWVGNVEPGRAVSAADAEALFSSYGTVQQVSMQVAPAFCFAVVKMGSAAEAASAHAALHLSRDTGISAGKPLKLRYAWPRSRVRPAGGGGAFLSSQPSGASSIAGSISGSAPEVMSEPRCDACGVPAAVVPLKRCSGCKAVLVCSAECQQLSWQAGHHEDCAQLARLGEALGGDDVTPATLKLLAAALQRPAAREGRMLQAVLAQQAAAAAQ